MKKFIKIFIAIILLSVTAFAFTSCNFHKHVYQDYLIKNPTCTEMGILKRLCIECGITKYSEINTTKHNYVNGICSGCGISINTKNELITYSMPENANNIGMWSFDEIYETACSVGCIVSYSEFMTMLSGSSLKNASADILGILHITATCYIEDGKVYEFPLVLNFERVSPTNPSSPMGVLLRADIENNELLLTYTTGSQVPAGKLISKSGKSIIGFGINANNELVVYYSDNTIAFAGRFSS